MKVSIHCDGICCENTLDVEVPAPGWVNRLDEVETGGDGSYLFCPACAPQEPWFDAVCPGCASGFRECGLSKATMYTESPGLTDAQRRSIGSGRCPFRVNGTFFIGGGGPFHEADISEQAPTESGAAVLAGFKAYSERYGTK